MENTYGNQEFTARDVIFREGEAGDKLYVVAQGKLQVKISGTSVRELGPGVMFGELALLYDGSSTFKYIRNAYLTLLVYKLAPRTATVECLENSTVWTLRREFFKYIQAITASGGN